MSDIQKTYFPYFRGKLIRNHEDGYSIIVPSNQVAVVPMNCPICDSLLRSLDDELSYNSYECCEWCATTWVYANRQKWIQGWRPDTKVVAEAIKNRPRFSIKLV